MIRRVLPFVLLLGLLLTADRSAGPPTYADPELKLKDRQHWSCIPPKRTEVPKTKQQVSNPIDAFILARLEKEGLKPAAQADKHTLVRRVTLDLTGLPPTPEEVEAFL